MVISFYNKRIFKEKKEAKTEGNLQTLKIISVKDKMMLALVKTINKILFRTIAISMSGRKNFPLPS